MVTLNRIIIFGNDIKGLTYFYQTNFKLNLIEEIEGEWVVFEAGSIEIAFHRIGALYQSDKPFRAESNTKLVFDIKEELNNFRNRLIENGVRMKDIKSFDTSGFL